MTIMLYSCIVTCGVLLQAHVKSQFVCQWTRSSQTAQVLQDEEKEKQVGVVRLLLLRGEDMIGQQMQHAWLYSKFTHHAGVSVFQEDGMTVQEGSVTTPLWWLGEEVRQSQFDVQGGYHIQRCPFETPSSWQLNNNIQITLGQVYRLQTGALGNEE